MSERAGVPTFAAAIKEFQRLLVGQDVSPELLWVFRADVTSYKRRILIRVPIPPENEGTAESLYERGSQRGLGIALNVLCLLDSRPCCYIWLPADEMEAERTMTAGLKLSVPTNLLNARSIRNPLLWRVHTWLDEMWGWRGVTETLPCKRSPPEF